MSASFQTTCGRCHGAAGEGQPLYPALPGKLDRQAFQDVVRKGRGNMPAFPASFYADADLLRDFDAVSGRPAGQSPTGLPAAGEWTWTEAQVNQALARGLAMFRTPDKHGAACASCHSPDGIDLAAIAYPDAAILRRGALHLAPEQVLVIVDYVHALRRRFNIKEPCDPLRFRPFQPGGEPLPGATPAEQDLAFGEHLKSLGLLLATGKVDSAAAAQKAWSEMVALDLRKVKIPVEFPRWTEDGFNGAEHSSLNDWLPSTPRRPRSGSSQMLFALDDSYLADPSEDNLRKLDEAIAQPDNMVGTAHPFFDHVMAIKWRSVLLASHFFRMALVGKPGWFDKPKVPFPQFGRLYNPFFKQGVRSKEGVLCGGGCEAAIASLPEEARKELRSGGSAADQINRLSGELAHPWFTMGQLLDQGLLQTENGSDGTTLNPFYWNLNRFPHNQVGKPFMNAHRVVTQVHYVTKLGGTDGFPRRLADVSAPPVTNPLLLGKWMVVEGLYGFIEGESGLPSVSDKRAAIAVRVKTNVIRMFLYQQRDLLKGGATASGLGGPLGRWRDFTSALARGSSLLSLPELSADKTFFVDSDALLAEVLSLTNGGRPVATP